VTYRRTYGPDLRTNPPTPLPGQKEHQTMSKFDSARAEALYNASLDGTADTVGDVQFGTHYSRVIDWCDPESTDDNGHAFDGDYIVCEDSQGFVSILGPFEDIDIRQGGYFSPSDEAWQACEDEWSDFYEDEDEDEEPSCPQCGAYDHSSVLACDLLMAERLLS
jgi:hypothetical protein